MCRTGSSAQIQSPPLDTSIYHYRALVGGLNYIACGTRPDITYAVNQVSRYANAPTQQHWAIAIDCMRYLVHTKWWGIVLGSGGAIDHSFVKHKMAPPLPSTVHAVAYADANHGTGIDDRKSVTGSLIQVLGGPVSWGSHVQPTQSTSTVDSEIHAMSVASREALWVAKMQRQFGLNWRPCLIRGDSSGAISAVKNHSYTKHTKHIGIHQDFMRAMYRLGDLDFQHISGADNPADIFTKALPQPAFTRHRQNIGMMELPSHLRK